MVEQELLVGFGKGEITPKRDVPLEGYEERFAWGAGNSGVLDKLYVKVLSLQQGEKEIILATLDICLLQAKQLEELRNSLAISFGMGTDNINIVCTHTHSGPVTGDPWGRNLSNQEQAISDNFIYIKNQLVMAALLAKATMRPCSCFTSTARSSISYNRRVKQEDGSTKMVFSLWEHQDQIPNGIVDDDIPVMVLERNVKSYLAQGGPERIVLYSVAVHPVTLGKYNTRISADYPGMACRVIQEELEHTEAMFFPGCCGDTEPNAATQCAEKGLTIIGKAVGYSVLSSLYNKKQIPKSEKALDILCEEIDQGYTQGPLSIRTIKICDSYLCMISAECFVDLGIRIRRKHKQAHVLMSTVSNGWIGYVPNRQDYDDGGYEIVNSEKNGITKDTMEKIEAICMSQIKKLSER